MKRKSYLMVECKRDHLLFSKLKEKNLIPMEIDILKEHRGKDFVFKKVPDLLAVYPRLYIALDLDDYTEDKLVATVAQRLDGTNTAGGKHLHKLGMQCNIVYLELRGGKRTETKTLYVIPLGSPDSWELKRLGINRFMVEDYYVKAALLIGELKEEEIRGRYTTSKEIIERGILQEHMLEEEDYLIELLERSELDKIADDIIKKIKPSLEV